MVRANLRDEGPARDICILDISTRGLLATTARPPAFGDFVEIRVDDNSLVGHVKWSGERRFGIVFQDRISVIKFLNGGKGSIQLPKQRRFAMASMRGAATLDDSRRKSQIFQFAVLIASTGLAALFIAGLVRDSLGAISLTGP